MKLDIIRDEAGFAALEPVWDALLMQSSTHSPFQAWDYVRLWWAACRDEFQLCIGVVRDDEEQVVGIAPLVIGKGAGTAEATEPVVAIAVAATAGGVTAALERSVDDVNHVARP